LFVIINNVSKGRCMSWETQERQDHGWFGHGAGPDEEKEADPAEPGSLFDPLSVGQRVDYASGSVVAHSPRDQRSQWGARVSGANRESLKTAFAVWYGASKLSRDTFHQQLLDPNTNDETVDRLRSAAKGIVEARTYAQLNDAGENLATAAQTIGLDRWPRFLGNAERRAVAAVSDGAIPGVVKASATGTDMGTGLGIGLGLVLLIPFFKTLNLGPARPSVTPSTPARISPISPTDNKGKTAPKAEPSTGAASDLAPGPGGVVVSDDRRRHILDGDVRGGGHRPGQNVPGKSEFPPDWSDDRIVDAIKSVANDPASSRDPGRYGRIVVNGSRDGVDIEVIVEGDKTTVVSGYPTNRPRNPK